MSQLYFKEESKKEWYTNLPINNNDLQTGCLMRIADATEKMASNYVRMENDLKWHRDRAEEREAIITRLTRSNNALRGHLNRIKKLK